MKDVYKRQEYDHQQHFELLLSIHRVRMPRRHEDGLAGVQHMGYCLLYTSPPPPVWDSFWPTRWITAQSA